MFLFTDAYRRCRFSKLLTKATNSEGPKIFPCGTPQAIYRVCFMVSLPQVFTTSRYQINCLQLLLLFSNLLRKIFENSNLQKF